MQSHDPRRQVIHGPGKLVVVGVVALLALGCQPSAPAGLSEADQAAIRKMNDDAVALINAKDWDGYGKLFAEDGVMLPPNAPALSGRQAVVNFGKAYPPVSDFKAELLALEGRGDLAYGQGKF